MPWSYLIPTGTALLAALLTHLLNRWDNATERSERRIDERAAREQTTAADTAARGRAKEQEAIQQLLVATRLLTNRANGFRMTVKMTYSRQARRDRRRGIMLPLDVDAAFDRLVEARPRYRAGPHPRCGCTPPPTLCA